MSDLFTLLYAIAVLMLLTSGLIYTYYHYKLGVGPAPSSKAARAAMAAEIHRLIQMGLLPSNPKIVDMGSGTGGLVRSLAKALPNAQVTGLDLSIPVHCLAWLCSKIFGPKNTRFVLTDFGSYDVSNTHVVVTYLTGNILKALSPHLKVSLPKGAVVLCLNYSIPDMDWDNYKTITINSVIEPALYCHRLK